MNLKSLLANQKLTSNFYKNNLLDVARNLLGKIFVVKDGNRYLAGVIVDVEAYSKNNDKASHSSNGRTERNKSMFAGGGTLYIYRSYGIHFCANVVTGEVDSGEAVLLRAIEPKYNIKKLAVNRFGTGLITPKQLNNLTNGPGKICSAFGINKDFDGTDLNDNQIFILDNKMMTEFEIIKTTRIGITKSTDLLWRFYIKNSPFVLKK
jgi:DNA-3-methyladenine glycosylase